MKKLSIFILSLLMSYYLLAQEKVSLYKDNIPNARISQEELGEENIPVLYRYMVEGSRKAVLVIPGGGYVNVAIHHEGHDIAKAFNEQGYNAFVLYYRLPKDATMQERKIGPLQDAQRAMQYIREQYDYAKVGVIGFSAGGHLAASLSNHFDDVKIENPKHTSLRPDFSVLIYPVISMDEQITHKGSKTNLIGTTPSDADVQYFSLEQQVSKQTPPTFLVHAKDDKAVVLDNSLRYKKALDKYAVPNSIFIYETGGHGFGLNNKTDDRKWSDQLFDWLKTVL